MRLLVSNKQSIENYSLLFNIPTNQNASSKIRSARLKSLVTRVWSGLIPSGALPAVAKLQFYWNNILIKWPAPKHADWPESGPFGPFGRSADVLSGRHIVREFLGNIFSRFSGRQIVRICGTSGIEIGIVIYSTSLI